MPPLVNTAKHKDHENESCEPFVFVAFVAFVAFVFQGERYLPPPFFTGALGVDAGAAAGATLPFFDSSLK